jgi:hypothetical protein
MGYVFDSLEFTKDVDDLRILFVEDDHYLMPDAIHMLKMMSNKYRSKISATFYLFYLIIIIKDRKRRTANYSIVNRYFKFGSTYEPIQ